MSHYRGKTLIGAAPTQAAPGLVWCFEDSPAESIGKSALQFAHASAFSCKLRYIPEEGLWKRRKPVKSVINARENHMRFIMAELPGKKHSKRSATGH
jgi:hypothetical protein